MVEGLEEDVLSFKVTRSNIHAHTHTTHTPHACVLLQAIFALEKELIAAQNAEKFAQAEAHREATYKLNEDMQEDKRAHYEVSN